MINCMLAIISWGYTNMQRSWIYYLRPLYYRTTFNVISHDLMMENIAF
jgi:hypothetical protein